MQSPSAACRSLALGVSCYQRFTAGIIKALGLVDKQYRDAVIDPILELGLWAEEKLLGVTRHIDEFSKALGTAQNL